MKSSQSLPTHGRGQRPWFLSALAALALSAALASSVFAQPVLITGPTDPNLSVSGNAYVVAEYYGTDFGPLPVGNVVFVNGNARLVASTAYGNPANFGTSQDALNLATISGDCMWRGYPGIPFSLQVTAGHTYKLQMIFRDVAYSASGRRIFDVTAGGVTLASMMDLAALGAGSTNNAAIVLNYTFTSTDGSPLQIALYPEVENTLINALTLEDVTPAGSPVIVVAPSSRTNFVGRSVRFDGRAVGTLPLAYQWQAGAVGSGVYTNLVDSTRVSGSTTYTLTISNLTAADQADYVLAVTNSVSPGTVTTPATLTVLPIPGPIVPGSSYPYYIMTNNPAAYWRLNDSSSYRLVYDSSPGAHDGTALANATLGVSGPRPAAFSGFEVDNTALQMHGTGTPNGWVTTTSPLNLDKLTTNNVTIIAWVNPAANQYPGTAIVLERNNNNSGSDLNKNGLVYNTYAMGDGDYELGYLWNANSYGWRSGLEVPHNIWSMVALVVTPTNSTVYICNANGMRSATNVTSNGIANPLTTATPWSATTYIGYDTFTSGWARQFNGSIDEVAILPTSLTSDQILALAAAGIGPNLLAPHIETQPRGASVGLGATKQITVTATGSSPLHYQWQAGAVSSGTFTNLADALNFSGSQTAGLTITGFGPTNVADYRVVITNSLGSVTSSVARLFLNVPAPDNSYSYAIFTNAPYAYWRMNEGPGSPVISDTSPAGGFDGTPLASTALGIAGPQTADGFPGFETANTSLQLAIGHDDGYATFPSLGLANINSVTITAWIKPSGPQQIQTGLVFLKGTGDGGLNYSSFTDGSGNSAGLGYTWNGGNGNWNTGLQPPIGIWSFVALVVTPTDATIYLFNANGMTSSYLVNNHAATSFSAPGAIGANTYYVNWGAYKGIFDGDIDEVAVFNKALSGSLIQSLYAKAVGASGFPVVIQQQPRSAGVLPGGAARFTVSAFGTGPTYQWQARGIGSGAYSNLLDAGGISGSQTATLTISNATAANVAQYQVVVANAMPSSDTSAPVKLLLVTPASPALIGQWLTGAQDFQDKSGFTPGGAHDGAVWSGGGSPSWLADVPPGFSGSSIYLDGASAIMIGNSANSDLDYRTTFDASIAHKFTIAFWARGFPPHGWNPIVTKGGNGNPGWQVRSDGGGAGANPTFSLWGTATTQADAGDGAAVNLNDSQWHHFAGTYDSQTGVRHLYVDGVSAMNIYGDFGTTSSMNGDTAAMAVDANHHLAFGAIEATGAPPGWFNGQFFDVRMYNYALSAPEVQALISPPQPSAVALYLGATNPVPIGQKLRFTVLIPQGANASGPVTVWVTNLAPAVATIEGASGNVFTVTFAAGAPCFQDFMLDAVGLGQVQLAAGANSGLNSATLAATANVVSPQLVGRWLSGPADLVERSGFRPGVHNGIPANGSGLNNGTPVFTNDVPPGFSGSSLKFDLTYMVVIANSCNLNWEGNYQPTFDEYCASAFSVSFWAKGTYFPGWQPWVAKRGASSFGWQFRAHGSDNVPTFTLRMTGDFPGGQDDPFISQTRIDGSFGATWHHYTATYDSVAGVRKLYVDGKLDLTVPNDFGPYGLAKPNYLTIGGWDNDANGTTGPVLSGFLFGQMFDVRMYNCALNASEVQTIMRPTTSALVAAVDSAVIDQGHNGTVSLSIPASANASQPVTVWVTNLTPTVVSVAGASGNVFPVTFATGAYPSKALTLSGLSDGQAQLAFGAAGLTSASTTLPVYGPRLVARWVAGNQSLAELSGFRPAGTHDGVAGGASPSHLAYSTDVPAGFAGRSLSCDATYAVRINNSSGFDASYTNTFDDVIANNFTIALWEKAVGNGWNAFVSKNGDSANMMGFQVRGNGTGTAEAFTLIETALYTPDVKGTAAVYNGAWHHIAAVYDGYSGTRKVYVDSVLDPSINTTGDFGPFMMAKNRHLVLGSMENNNIASPGYANAYLNGKLYDVRIYNYPLTATQVQSLLTAPPRPQLAVQAGPGGTVQISWPVSAAAYALQTSSSLSGGWANSGLTVTTVGDQKVATDATGAATQFYRLCLP